MECAMAKVFATEGMGYIGDEGVQIYGGMGCSEKAPMEAIYRDWRFARIAEGTNEINRMITVGMLLKSALSKKLDIMTPL